MISFWIRALSCPVVWLGARPRAVAQTRRARSSGRWVVWSARTRARARSISPSCNARQTLGSRRHSRSAFGLEFGGATGESQSRLDLGSSRVENIVDVTID